MSDKVDGKTASPYGYPFWDWMAKEDPDYVRARGPVSALSVGEGKELSIKHARWSSSGSSPIAASRAAW
jgi:hypothetical protein